MKTTLIQNLLSRIPKKEYYPTKNKKKEKPAPIYFFVSVKYFERQDPETKVVSTHQIGFTYRKE